MIHSINIFNRQRKIKLSLDTKKLVKTACIETLNHEKFPNDCEVEVSFVSDKRIKELNSLHRNIDSSTDVLSFPLGENGQYDENPANGKKMLGDVIISVEHAYAQAELYGHGIEREIAFLTVHSMLHLLGYDHVNGGIEEKNMRSREEEILSKMGLSVKKD